MKTVSLEIESYKWYCPKKKCSDDMQCTSVFELEHNDGQNYVTCDNCETMYKVNFID